MRSLVAVSLAVVIGTAVSSGASAQQASPMDRPGLDVGARLGFAFPFGKLAGGTGSNAISDYLSGAIPLVLELGYRINARATVGALFQYAYGLPKDCPSGSSCSGSAIRLGIEGLFHIPTAGPFVPWLGLGTGYEWLSLDQSYSGMNYSSGYHGFEFFTLQGGGDYRVSPHFSLGPFVSFSLARYDTESLDSGGSNQSGDIPNKEIHEWLQFGVKGTFNL